MSYRFSFALVVILVFALIAQAKPIHHYVFFAQDREKLRTTAALFELKEFEGAQVAYSWRQLEPEKDKYDFSLIIEDLEYLKSQGKRLFVQFQDVTFSDSRINAPRYLLNDPVYNGGVARQFQIPDDHEELAKPAGWVARRWDPAVQERLYKLFEALGREFDTKIEGINLAESSVGFGWTGNLFPTGFTHKNYRDAIIANMGALKRAFPRSVVIEYANFMPGEWRPVNDKGYLRAVYEAAVKLNVGVGGPDLRPYRPGQMKSSYELIRKVAGKVPVGIAVQDGDYENIDPKTGQLVSIKGTTDFARDYLRMDYIFWCTEEPYFSRDLVPFLKK